MYILDENDNPQEVDTLEWGIWMQTANRVVEKTKVGGAEVSTVFLGLDHNWSMTGNPILWETLVFGSSIDEEMDRYDSKDAAVKGHWEMVKRVQDFLENGSTTTPLEDCPDCSGTGEYVGIKIRQDCQTCNGTGKA